MSSITITMPRLHPSQRVVRDSPARFKVLACGRRWGKTLLGVALCVEAGVTCRDAWWIAPTFPIASIGWRAIKSLIRQIPGSELREGERLATLPGGGWIQVKSADDPDSLRGQGLDLAVFDECAFQVEAAWTEAVRPALSDRAGKALFISTPQGRNWFWRLWMRGQEGGSEWTSWQFPTSDNPYIDPQEIEAARADSSAQVFAQEYEADFSLSVGTFFPEWSEAKHVIPPRDIPSAWPRWVAVDWGFADPFVALWLARDPETRRIYVYREVYERGLREEQQALLLLQLTGTEHIRMWVGDPSMWNARAESNRPSIASIYRVNTVPIQPAANSRVPGWQRVRATLAGGPPRLQVLGNCRNLIRTLPEMVHDPIDIEDLADSIKGSKTEDHAVDCLRYALFAEASEVGPASKVAVSVGGAPPKDKRHWSERSPSEFVRR
jgi:hypothetical protein